MPEDATTPSDCRSLLIRNPSSLQPLANVFFNDSMRVQAVRKYWDQGFQGTQPDKFLSEFFAVLSRGLTESSHDVRIRTEERREPGILQRLIVLEYPTRTVTISYTEGVHGADGARIAPFVNLFEELR